MNRLAVDVFHYRLPLRRSLVLGGRSLAHREGFLIRLCSESNTPGEGWGEAAPLPGFSRENLEEATDQIRAVAGLIRKEGLPPETTVALSGEMEGWLGGMDLAPSVRFGVELAAVRLAAQQRGMTLRQGISPPARNSVMVNGLLDETSDDLQADARRLRAEGFKCIKLKVGRRPVTEDMLRVKQVSEALEGQVTLRLDANRAWNREEAFSFAGEVAGLGVEYIEEPLNDPDSMLALIASGQAVLPVPVALDETLRDLIPEDLAGFSNLKAIVLKPTQLGLERSVQFARAAGKLGMWAVVSSSFESSVGLSGLAEVAAACVQTPHIAAGLGTAGWLAEDLLEPPLEIKNGAIDLAQPATSGIKPDCSRLVRLRDV